jgi:contact-dependent growth inhibition (CDI) system CdiI-like immunity protein
VAEAVVFWIGYEEPSSDPALAYGRIRIGDFHERFEMDLSFWSRPDYERHWLRGVGRLLAGGDVSCLVSAMRDPETAEFIIWWPLYRLGDEVKVQNQILFMTDLPETLDPEDPFRHVLPRTTSSTEGTPVSEWTTTMEALRQFMAGLSAG